MKIIMVDNFARESISDTLICENVSEHYGKLITEFLNDRLSGNESPVFFRLIADDHKLYKFEL